MQKKIIATTMMTGLTLTFSAYSINQQQIFLNLKNSLSPSSNQSDQHKKSQSTFQAINSSVTTPNAAGSTERSLFIGLGYLNNWSHTHTDNASLVIGTSLGNAKKNLGILVSMTSPFTENSKFNFNSHAISLRLNRYLNSSFSIAAGINNLIGTGDFSNSANDFFTVITGNFQAKHLPIMASIGIGTGSFNSTEDATNGKDSHLSLFFNLGVGLTKNWSLMTDWNAQSLSVGSTYIFHAAKNIPLALNVAVLNVATNQPSTKHKNTLAVSIAYAYSF